MPQLPIEKLKKLVTMLSSDNVGEVASAAAAIGRVLKEAGADWHDLAKAIGGPVVVRPPLAPAPWDNEPKDWDNKGASGWKPKAAKKPPEPPPLKPEAERPHVADVRWCLANGKFTTREKEFLESLINWNIPTQKQLDWLKKLMTRKPQMRCSNERTTMTVKELIDILKQLDPSSRVLIGGVGDEAATFDLQVDTPVIISPKGVKTNG